MIFTATGMPIGFIDQIHGTDGNTSGISYSSKVSKTVVAGSGASPPQ
jgi:hypothetical protein